MMPDAEFETELIERTSECYWCGEFCGGECDESEEDEEEPR